MSTKKKLQEKLQRIPPPKDFRWDDLVTVMDHLGFDLDQSGGGSHKHFVLRSDADKIVDIYRPHPNGIMYGTQLREIVEKLKDWGVL
jgi:hypothetical protein